MSGTGQRTERQRKRAFRLAGAVALVALLGGCSSLQSVAHFLGFGSDGDREAAQPVTPASVAAAPDRAVALAALAQDPVSDDTLSEKRGGFSIAGMDFKFGLSLLTTTSNGLSLSTMLNLNDNGRWVPAMTQIQTTPTPGGQSAIIPLTFGGTSPGKPAGAPVTFSQSAGDPGTTQILNQIAGNNIQTLITNTMNNVNVNNQATLNVQVNGAPAATSRMAVFANVNKFADQMSRLYH